MLRWTTPFLVAVFAVGTAAAEGGPEAAKPAETPAAAKPADGPPVIKPATRPIAAKRAAARRAAVRAADQLPPGLPRVHYKYRTTVAPGAPLYVRRGRAVVVVEEQVEQQFSPLNPAPYAPRLVGTPLLPGSSTLPGYYGTSHSYSYDGPYYGGPYTPYWDRLPYACGVFGYC